MFTLNQVFSVTILLVAVHMVYNQPVTNSKPYCFKQPCPVGTLACEKYTNMTDDRKNINIKINCLDKDDAILKTIRDVQENKFPSLVLYQGYSYTNDIENAEGDSYVPPSALPTSTTEKSDKEVDPNSQIELLD